MNSGNASLLAFNRNGDRRRPINRRDCQSSSQNSRVLNTSVERQKYDNRKRRQQNDLYLDRKWGKINKAGRQKCEKTHLNSMRISRDREMQIWPLLYQDGGKDN